MILSMPSLPWILAVVAMVVVVGILALRPTRRTHATPLPTVWNLKARPVFSSSERRAYRHLREALPHHAVLSKLPLVRFCQPEDSEEIEYWYELLAPQHVAFAICSANGRVLAAIDLDGDKATPGRAQQIKHSVLEACRIRYLRCTADTLPSAAELQLLVPSHGSASRRSESPGLPADELHTAREALASTVANRRAERSSVWQESTVFQDSFFSRDSRLEGMSGSDFGSLGAPIRTRPMPNGIQGLTTVETLADDIGGIVEPDTHVARDTTPAHSR